jgi:hypothetical protein
LPPETPVVVSGSELRLAAQVVDRLAASSHERVWLLTR